MSVLPLGRRPSQETRISLGLLALLVLLPVVTEYDPSLLFCLIVVHISDGDIYISRASYTTTKYPTIWWYSDCLTNAHNISYRMFSLVAYQRYVCICDAFIPDFLHPCYIPLSRELTSLLHKECRCHSSLKI